jgi:hypothetical protein
MSRMDVRHGYKTVVLVEQSSAIYKEYLKPGQLRRYLKGIPYPRDQEEDPNIDGKTTSLRTLVK